jgi:hypothetical protein
MKSVIIILILAVGVILFMQLRRDESKQDIKKGTNPGEPYAGLKCSIRPLEGPFKRGDIKYILTLQNVSDEVIHLPETGTRESGLWTAMTGEKGERFLELTNYFPISVGPTIFDRTAITEIPPREKIEIPRSYGGYLLGKPTRFWCGLVVDPDMVPETYDGWTGSITSNVIEVDIVE